MIIEQQQKLIQSKMGSLASLGQPQFQPSMRSVAAQNERIIALKFGKKEKQVFQKSFAAVIKKKKGDPLVIDIDKLQHELSSKIMQGQWRAKSNQATVTQVTSPKQSKKRIRDEDSEEEPVAIEINIQGTVLAKILTTKWFSFELDEFRAFSKIGIKVKLTDILQVIDESLLSLKQAGLEDPHSHVDLLLNEAKQQQAVERAAVNKKLGLNQQIKTSIKTYKPFSQVTRLKDRAHEQKPWQQQTVMENFDELAISTLGLVDKGPQMSDQSKQHSGLYEKDKFRFVSNVHDMDQIVARIDFNRSYSRDLVSRAGDSHNTRYQRWRDAAISGPKDVTSDVAVGYEREQTMIQSMLLENLIDNKSANAEPQSSQEQAVTAPSHLNQYHKQTARLSNRAQTKMIQIDDQKVASDLAATQPLQKLGNMIAEVWTKSNDDLAAVAEDCEKSPGTENYHQQKDSATVTILYSQKESRNKIRSSATSELDVNETKIKVITSENMDITKQSGQGKHEPGGTLLENLKRGQSKAQKLENFLSHKNIIHQTATGSLESVAHSKSSAAHQFNCLLPRDFRGFEQIDGASTELDNFLPRSVGHLLDSVNTGPGTARSTYQPADTASSNNVTAQPPVINSKTSSTQRWLYARQRQEAQMQNRMMSPVIKKSRDRSDERKPGATQQITINSGGKFTRAVDTRKNSATDGEALRVFKAVSPGLESPEELISNNDDEGLVALTHANTKVQMNVNLKQQFNEAEPSAAKIRGMKQRAAYVNHESLETYQSHLREEYAREYNVEPGDSDSNTKSRVTVVQRSRSPAKSIGKMLQGGRSEMQADHVSLKTYFGSNVAQHSDNRKQSKGSRNPVEQYETEMTNTIFIQGDQLSPQNETENANGLGERPKKRQVYRSKRELRSPETEEQKGSKAVSPMTPMSPLNQPTIHTMMEQSHAAADQDELNQNDDSDGSRSPEHNMVTTLDQHTCDYGTESKTVGQKDRSVSPASVIPQQNGRKTPKSRKNSTQELRHIAVRSPKGKRSTNRLKGSQQNLKTGESARSGVAGTGRQVNKTLSSPSAALAASGTKLQCDSYWPNQMEKIEGSCRDNEYQESSHTKVGSDQVAHTTMHMIASAEEPDAGMVDLAEYEHIVQQMGLMMEQAKLPRYPNFCSDEDFIPNADLTGKIANGVVKVNSLTSHRQQLTAVAENLEYVAAPMLKFGPARWKEVKQDGIRSPDYEERRSAGMRSRGALPKRYMNHRKQRDGSSEDRLNLVINTQRDSVTQQRKVASPAQMWRGVNASNWLKIKKADYIPIQTKSMRNLAKVDVAVSEACQKSAKTVIKPINNTEQLVRTYRKAGKLISEEAIKLVINTEDEDLLLKPNEPRSPTKGRTPGGNLSKSQSRANMSLVDTFKRRQRGLNTLKVNTSEANSPARSRNGSDFDHHARQSPFNPISLMEDEVTVDFLATKLTKVPVTDAPEPVKEPSYPSFYTNKASILSKVARSKAPMDLQIAEVKPFNDILPFTVEALAEPSTSNGVSHTEPDVSDAGARLSKPAGQKSAVFAGVTDSHLPRPSKTPNQSHRFLHGRKDKASVGKKTAGALGCKLSRTAGRRARDPLPSFNGKALEFNLKDTDMCISAGSLANSNQYGTLPRDSLINEEGGATGTHSRDPGVPRMKDSSIVDCEPTNLQLAIGSFRELQTLNFTDGFNAAANSALNTLAQPMNRPNTKDVVSRYQRTQMQQRMASNKSGQLGLQTRAMFKRKTMNNEEGKVAELPPRRDLNVRRKAQLRSAVRSTVQTDSHLQFGTKAYGTSQGPKSKWTSALRVSGIPKQIDERHPLPLAEMPGMARIDFQPKVSLPPHMQAALKQQPLSTRSTAHLHSQASRGSLTTRAGQSFLWPLLQAGMSPKAPPVCTQARSSKMNILNATEPADNQQELLAPDNDASPIASVGSGGGRASGSAAQSPISSPVNYHRDRGTLRLKSSRILSSTYASKLR